MHYGKYGTGVLQPYSLSLKAEEDWGVKKGRSIESLTDES